MRKTMFRAYMFAVLTASTLYAELAIMFYFPVEDAGVATFFYGATLPLAVFSLSWGLGARASRSENLQKIILQLAVAFSALGIGLNTGYSEIRFSDPVAQALIEKLSVRGLWLGIEFAMVAALVLNIRQLGAIAFVENGET